MSTRDLLAAAVDLYGLLPGEFVRARDDRAKQARADGEPQLAREVKALRKPAGAAWLANVMVRHMTDEIEQVLELGQAMREAQEDLDAAELKTLNRQRRQLVDAVVRQGRKVAADLGQKVNDVAAQQAAATLQAAMADEGAEAALRTGLLVEPMVTTGLDPVDLTGVLAVPEALGGACATTGRAEGGARTWRAPEQGGRRGGAARRDRQGRAGGDRGGEQGVVGRAGPSLRGGQRAPDRGAGAAAAIGDRGTPAPARRARAHPGRGGGPAGRRRGRAGHRCGGARRRRGRRRGDP
ncbi:hypothetical protein [Georgenia sp. SUBG003]|uniref:hypothetical protein n=1 Tax=Georgenia sp. SUBG003 TaxID=1497974 RepID=UPI003AB73DBD